MPSNKTTANIQVIQENIVPDSFDDSQLPTDIHIITYKIGNETHFDAVRAYAKVDIFDAYYDKLQADGEILSIKSGYGKIKPKLYGKIKTED